MGYYEAVIERFGSGPALSTVEDLEAFFDRVVCINLDHREDRWAHFQENVADVNWPFASIERFSAVDGKKAPPPFWWRAGAGAWGCFQSHIRILEQALHDEIDSVLILEDDAILPQGFDDLVAKFLMNVPQNWDGLMLGGQHLRQPDSVAEGVMRVRNGNRTHAHALRGRYIRAAYQHLCDYPAHVQTPGHHVDHRLGVLHEGGQFQVYAPSPWLVGQRGGRSDIAQRGFTLRFWSDGPWQQDDTTKLAPFVSVIGLHRSGSSCLAGVLHALGVHMGNEFGGCEPSGGFEAIGLAALCEQAYPFPSTQLAMDHEQLSQKLKAWIIEKRREAFLQNTIAGGKYPHLCVMGDVLLNAAGDDLRVIHIDRPLQESISSLKRRSKRSSGWLQITDEQSDRVQEWLWEEKQILLSSVDHLTVQYHDLCADPRAEIDRIVTYLGIQPSRKQFERAVQHVSPQKVIHVEQGV